MQRGQVLLWKTGSTDGAREILQGLTSLRDDVRFF